MLKKYIVIMLSLLMLELAGCGTPAKVQSNNSEPETTNVIVYEADSTSTTVTSEIMSSVMDALNARFKDLGFESIGIERVDNKQLKVQLKPSNPDIKQMAEIVGQPNKVKIIGPNNEVIITEKDIKSATPNKDERYKTFDIQFSSDAATKLSNATKRLIGKKSHLLLG